MSRTPDPQLSFADLNWSRLGVHLDPVLQRIGSFLDQHSNLVEQVRLDLERGLKNPSTGRSGITPSQTPAFAGLSCASRTGTIANCVSASTTGYTLRGFTQFDTQLVPKQ